MSTESFRLPEVVFAPSGEDSITPQPLALVKNGLDAAIKSKRMQADSYRICPETSSLIVSEETVNDIARGIFSKHIGNHALADMIVAEAFRQYRLGKREDLDLQLDAAPAKLTA